ncbi:MAG: hypothetical protein LC797_07385 [Chloroflexi bacterium]|nr:hypothetical protein [Chloroflexota bacterium]
MLLRGQKSREATALLRSEAEVLTDVPRAEGVQRTFEAIMFNKADMKSEMDRWNRDVQDALGNL